ncbi:MAG: Spx/MgsR family RNA polymerase-binding regulatory protein [Myxococcota bacterium]
MEIVLYGIPTCDSCRKARRWLDAQGHAYRWVDLRDAPPAAAKIKAWVDSLGSKPLRNTSGGSYRALGEEKKSWTDAQWSKAFSKDPMLLKRPVLEVDGTARATGFKPDSFKPHLNA